MRRRRRERPSAVGRLLIDAWREEAEMFRREGKIDKARRYRAVADRMVLALRTVWREADPTRQEIVSE